VLSGTTPMRRLMLVRRGLIAATPFAIIGALYIAGKNQLLGLLVVVAFFAIAMRFARIQEKVEAQATAPADSHTGAGERESA
jgi:hypothetical protein